MSSSVTDLQKTTAKKPFRPMLRVVLIGIAIFGLFRLGENLTSEWRYERATSDHRPLSARMASAEKVALEYFPEMASTIENAEEVTAQGEAAAREQLLDPWSARFKTLELAYSPSYQRWFVCGEVNAKNRFGAYLGFRQFAIPMRGNDIGAEIRFGSLEFFDQVSYRTSDAKFDRVTSEVSAKCGLSAKTRVIEQVLNSLAN